jgi:hypothetical protein
VSYEPTSLNVDGTLPVRRSIAAGELPLEIRPGELAVNAADGVVHVGLNDGLTSTLPNAIGFSTIQIIGEGDYEALVDATATIATVLYIVTPDPEPDPE